VVQRFLKYNPFILLCTILRPHIVRGDTNHKEAVRANKIMVTILYKLDFEHNDKIPGQKFVQEKSTI
jgi:hypothetical protein